MIIATEIFYVSNNIDGKNMDLKLLKVHIKIKRYVLCFEEKLGVEEPKKCFKLFRIWYIIINSSSYVSRDFSEFKMEQRVLVRSQLHFLRTMPLTDLITFHILHSDFSP